MKFEIAHRVTGMVLFSLECELFKVCVEAAVKAGADLAGANLAGADLAGANLAGANLADADLARADLARANLADADLARADLARANLADAYLARANLADANLADANLAGAYLAGANLADANLAGAYLARADLARANLADAYLARADLARANLADAYLARADLAGANLADADLARAENSTLIFARTSILPSDGDLVGWKQCKDGVLVKLRIPADAKRSNASGRKCRAEFADVIEIIGATEGRSKNPSGRGEELVYRVGERVKPVKPFDENRWKECSTGIHFYITRIEAEND